MICFKLFTKWKDSRLQFSQLQSNMGDNVVDGVVWKPSYNFTNIIFQDLRSYYIGSLAKQFLLVDREQNVTTTISSKGSEGKKHKRKDVTI